MPRALSYCALAPQGPSFADPPQLDLRASFADSTPATPIIFVLSPGTDPLSYLRQLAAERGFTDKLRPKSLGKGQGEDAERLIRAARAEGEWVWSAWCGRGAARGWKSQVTCRTASEQWEETFEREDLLCSRVYPLCAYVQPTELPPLYLMGLPQFLSLPLPPSPAHSPLALLFSARVVPAHRHHHCSALLGLMRRCQLWRPSSRALGFPMPTCTPTSDSG